jgi:hypothetical protein
VKNITTREKLIHRARVEIAPMALGVPAIRSRLPPRRAGLAFAVEA